MLQGSVLSPLVFNIYIDDLLEELEKANKIEDLYAYADDIMIFQESIVKTGENIQVIKKWCHNNLMNLNEDKCGVLQIFQNKR